LILMVGCEITVGTFVPTVFVSASIREQIGDCSSLRCPGDSTHPWHRPCSAITVRRLLVVRVTTPDKGVVLYVTGD